MEAQTSSAASYHIPEIKQKTGTEQGMPGMHFHSLFHTLGPQDRIKP